MGQNRNGSDNHSNPMLNTKVIQLIDKDVEFVLPHIKAYIRKTKNKNYTSIVTKKLMNDNVMFRKFFIHADKRIKKAIFDTIFIISSSISDLISYDKNEFTSRHKHIDIISKDVFKNKLEFELVFSFVEVVVNYSKYLSKINERIRDKTRTKYESKLKSQYVLDINTKVIKSFYSLPIKDAPKDWIKVGKKYIGGYHNRQVDLVIIKSRNHSQPQISNDVLNSINYIQSVAWEINKEVLNQLEKDLIKPNCEEEKYNRYKKPSDKDIDFNYESDPKLLSHNLSGPSGLGPVDKNGKGFKFYSNAPKEFYTKEELNQAIQKRSNYYELDKKYKSGQKRFNSDLSKYRALKLAINIANKFINDVIYFPHRFDSRGRIYPIPVGLHPQGSDAIKALLHYRDGHKLNNIGINWSWSYLASLFGDDKLPFSDRVEKGKTLVRTDYKKAENPYQFLAHQLELNKWIENNEYQIKTSIHIDACNSGSQLASAITGDISGMTSTNVLPCFNKDILIRNDLYQEVADDVLNQLEIQHDKLIFECKEPTYHNFFKILLKKYGRKICKIPVMTYNYGATVNGMNESIFQSIQELDIKDNDFFTHKDLRILTNLIKYEIDSRIEGSRRLFNYLTDISKLISKNKKFPTWKSLDGFEVIVRKMKVKIYKKQLTFLHRVEIEEDIFEDSQDNSGFYFPSGKFKTESKTTSISIGYETIDIDIQKIQSAIAPNYIHSLDATLLRMTALEMKKEGIRNSAWIHDSFGCSPNDVDTMLLIIKQQFIKLIQSNPLEEIKTSLNAQARMNYGSKKEISKEKKKSDRIIDKISDIAFNSEFNIQDILKSEWFFN